MGRSSLAQAALLLLLLAQAAWGMHHKHERVAESLSGGHSSNTTSTSIVISGLNSTQSNSTSDVQDKSKAVKLAKLELSRELHQKQLGRTQEQERKVKLRKREKAIGEAAGKQLKEAQKALDARREDEAEAKRLARVARERERSMRQKVEYFQQRKEQRCKQSNSEASCKAQKTQSKIAGMAKRQFLRARRRERDVNRTVFAVKEAEKHVLEVQKKMQLVKEQAANVTAAAVVEAEAQEKQNAKEREEQQEAVTKAENALEEAKAKAENDALKARAAQAKEDEKKEAQEREAQLRREMKQAKDEEAKKKQEEEAGDKKIEELAKLVDSLRAKEVEAKRRSEQAVKAQSSEAEAKKRKGSSAKRFTGPLQERLRAAAKYVKKQVSELAREVEELTRQAGASDDMRKAELGRISERAQRFKSADEAEKKSLEAASTAEQARSDAATKLDDAKRLYNKAVAEYNRQANSDTRTEKDRRTRDKRDAEQALRKAEKEAAAKKEDEQEAKSRESQAERELQAQKQAAEQATVNERNVKSKVEQKTKLLGEKRASLKDDIRQAKRDVRKQYREEKKNGGSTKDSKQQRLIKAAETAAKREARIRKRFTAAEERMKQAQKDEEELEKKHKSGDTSNGEFDIDRAVKAFARRAAKGEDLVDDNAAAHEGHADRQFEGMFQREPKHGTRIHLSNTNQATRGSGTAKEARAKLDSGTGQTTEHSGGKNDHITVANNNGVESENGGGTADVDVSS